MEISRPTIDGELHKSRERLTVALNEYIRRKDPRDVLFKILYQLAGLKAEQEALKLMVGRKAFRKSGFDDDMYLATVGDRVKHQAELIAASAGVIVTDSGTVLERVK